MCIFCQIISGEIPSHKVYEDENVLAFLDIQPVNPGHTLVVPKKHYQNLEEISEEDLKILIVAVKKIGHLLKLKLGIEGYNASTNNDPVAGQIVPHLHFHIIPRYRGDGHDAWSRCQYKPGEEEEIIKKLLS
ncbi:MAG: HIT family protein [Patescibacteria group bacterium]|jgi:histidine triad (HIT) family protein